MVSGGSAGYGDARTVRCAQCGALVPVALHAAEVTCTHCGHRQALDAQMLGGLQQYQRQYGQDVQSAQEHYAQAASMQAQQEQLRSPAKQYVLGFGLLMGLPTVAVVVGVALLRMGYLRNDQTPFISFAAMGAAMVGMVVYFVVWSIGLRTKTRTTAISGSTVACPSCGAAHAFLYGQALDRCRYCGASLLATQTVMQAGLDAARAARRHAELERWRKERSLIASYQGMGVSGTTVLFMAIGPMVVMVGISCVAFSWQMAIGEEPYSPAIFLLWAMLLGAIAVLGGATWWNRTRKHRLREASEALASQLGGQPLGSLQQMVQWLNHYWAGPYDAHHLSGVGLYGAACGTMQGYAVLGELFGSSDRYRRARVHLLIAAWIPGLSDGQGQPPLGGPAVEAERQALAQAGFDVELNQGGLLLVAEPTTVKRIVKNLPSFGQLAPALMHGVRMAQAMGATPVAGG